MDDDKLGAGFFLKVAGICVVVAIGVMIIALIFWRAVLAWGLLGAFLAIAAVALLFSWISDRRKARV